MKKALLSLIFTTLSFQALGLEAAKSNREFCGIQKDTNAIQDLAKNPSNHLSFRNQGGLINGGVCWWHSRFTRNALHLAIYRPDLAKPTVAQMKSIIKDIRAGKTVVTIPGFSNLSEFSRSARDLIQDELNAWQRFDGFVRQQWVVGLSGSTTTTSQDLSKKMDDLYEYVAINNNIAYQKLQMPGIVSHAWLVVDVDKTPGGYDLHIHDSNFYGVVNFKYNQGMTNFTYVDRSPFVPYTEQERELRNVKTVASRFCR